MATKRVLALRTNKTKMMIMMRVSKAFADFGFAKKTAALGFDFFRLFCAFILGLFYFHVENQILPVPRALIFILKSPSTCSKKASVL